MGSLVFYKGDFADHLHEIVGYKSGIAISIEQMCDLLASSYADEIISSETHGIRIRAEDYEELYYILLYELGVTEKKYNGVNDIIDLTRKHWEKYGEDFSRKIFDIYKEYISNKSEHSDIASIIKRTGKELGENGVRALAELMIEFDRFHNHNPHNIFRWQSWNNIVNLSDLFNEHQKVGQGEFFDQRFINYLSKNKNKLGEIHWRKFEELIAECFTRFGYKVELGPGSNDDGVDIRAWDKNNATSPEFLIQCKRQKEKINKVTIKALYADVLHESAKRGLLVTTSEFSIGAAKTINAREYPIEEVNGEMVKRWLLKLRTPGTGIVRV